MTPEQASAANQLLQFVELIVIANAETAILVAAVLHILGLIWFLVNTNDN